MRPVFVTLLAFSCGALGFSQTPGAPRPAFEVASVKPTDPELGERIDMRALPGGTLTATAVTLKFLITVAYGVEAVQVSGGPGWVDTAKFDILAKPAGVDRKYCTRKYSPCFKRCWRTGSTWWSGAKPRSFPFTNSGSRRLTVLSDPH